MAGYVVVYTVPSILVPITGTGMSLLLSLALSGVSPSLNSLSSFMRTVCSISSPRWVSTAIDSVELYYRGYALDMHAYWIGVTSILCLSTAFWGVACFAMCRNR